MATRNTPGARVTGTATTADDSLALEPNVMISGSSVRAIHGNLVGDGTSILTNVTRLLVFAGGPPILDVTPAMLRAVLGAYGKKAELATGGGRFTLPLSYGGINAAAPRGKLLRMITRKNATMAATTLDVGYTLADEEPEFWHSFLGQATGLAGSVVHNNAPVPVPEGGTLIGFTMPTANITLLRFHTPQGMTPLDYATNGQLLEAQELLRGTAVVDPLYVMLPAPVACVPGTRLELSTNASFAAGSEIGWLKVWPQ